MKKIRKAVVPVAGYGSRFLPATKSIPKEMLPIVDKPVVQYVIEELVAAGIEQIVLVTSWHKRSIEDYFDRHLELEEQLEKTGKIEQLEKIRNISKMAEFVYVRQKEIRGTGDALLTAKNIIGDEPFVSSWGDEIMLAEPNKTTQLINAYEKYGGTVLGALRTNDPADTKRYGYAEGPEVENGIIKIEELIEKPGPENPPSNLALLGGIVFSPDIFEALESCSVAEGKELVHVDGINALRKKGQNAYAVEIKNGQYLDCGNVMLYMKTNVTMALKRPELKEEFGKFIKETAKQLT